MCYSLEPSKHKVTLWVGERREGGGFVEGKILVKRGVKGREILLIERVRSYVAHRRMINIYIFFIFAFGVFLVVTEKKWRSENKME